MDSEDFEYVFLQEGAIILPTDVPDGVDPDGRPFFRRYKKAAVVEAEAEMNLGTKAYKHVIDRPVEDRSILDINYGGDAHGHSMFPARSPVHRMQGDTEEDPHGLDKGPTDKKNVRFVDRDGTYALTVKILGKTEHETAFIENYLSDFKPSPHKRSHSDEAEVVYTKEGDTWPGYVHVREGEDGINVFKRIRPNREEVHAVSVKIAVLFKLGPDGKQPVMKNSGDACWDLFASADYLLSAGHHALIPTDLYVAIPPGYKGEIQGRSGLCYDHGIWTHHGQIDSGYRKSIGVLIFNAGKSDYWVKKGDRIAQFNITKIIDIDWCAVETLPAASDGRVGGFGSTGNA
jgi:dUTP pyrophosphatase